MALSIKDPQADTLARAVADLTGESLTQAVIVALEQRLAREKAKRAEETQLMRQDVLAIARHCAALPRTGA